MAATTVLALDLVLLGLGVQGHEDTETAVRALAAETVNGTILADLVVLENSQLNLLVLVLDLLGGGVDLLLTLLTTTTQTQDQVEGRLLLDVVVRKSSAILELLAGENKTLLVRGDTLLVLDLGFDVIDSVGRLHLEGDRLSGQGLDEDLHFNGSSGNFLRSNR